MKVKYNWLHHVLNFLAVILGVYLAFLINERATLNRERNESAVLMNSMLNDLSEDIATYEKYQIPVNVQHQESVENLLQLLLTDSIDGKESELSSIFQVENFAPTTSTYSSMKASGKLGLIEDLSLQKKISDFYEVLVPESEKKGEYQVDFFTKELMTWYTHNIDLVDMRVLNKDELVVLRNKLIFYQSLLDQKVRTYEIIVEDSRKLMDRIELVQKSE